MKIKMKKHQIIKETIQKIKKVQKLQRGVQKVKLKVELLNANYVIKDIYLILHYILIANKSINKIIVRGGGEVGQKKKELNQRQKKINLILSIKHIFLKKKEMEKLNQMK